LPPALPVHIVASIGVAVTATGPSVTDFVHDADQVMNRDDVDHANIKLFARLRRRIWCSPTTGGRPASPGRGCCTTR